MHHPCHVQNVKAFEEFRAQRSNTREFECKLIRQGPLRIAGWDRAPCFSARPLKAQRSPASLPQGQDLRPCAPLGGNPSMSSASFDLGKLFGTGLPEPSARFTGFPKFNFIGGHNDPDLIPV